MINLFYICSCLILSGLGLTFLNEESLLAVCFFLFIALLLRYAQQFKVGQALQQSCSAIEQDLVNALLRNQVQTLKSQKACMFKRMAIIDSYESFKLMPGLNS